MLERQNPHLFLWVPVFLGLGIVLYFAQSDEPALTFSVSLLLFAALLLALRNGAQIGLYIFLSSLALVCAGFGYTALRVALVDSPVLGWRYYGAIEGRVIGMDRSAADAPRVLLDHVRLPGWRGGRVPVRVRVSLQGLITDGVLRPGARIMLTGSLAPPSAPVEPGGFDFRRMAWFQQLGAVGYTRNPAVLAGPPDRGAWNMAIFRLRMAMSKAIRAKINGQEGAFAAAILTGDRSAISAAVLTDLRRANLAHLLAISGLHMGLLTGFVFALLRYGLALLPYVAMRWPVKKFAAVVAIVAGGVYLALSGGNVATVRAFVMTLVVLVAVLADRPAFTLRAVALAAMVVMVLNPYDVLGAGFQMSFAATTALIAVYGSLRDSRFWQAMNHPRWLRPVLSVAVTSGVAGLATAPFSAFYFNQISHFGLLANVLSVPVMGFVIMPAVVIAAILYPFGLSGPVFSLMAAGLDWIMRVAHYVSTLPGATRNVVSAPGYVLGLLAAGMILALLLRGYGRLPGVAVILLSLVFWQASARPPLLVSQSGMLAGAMGGQGRAMSRQRSDGYSARIWLENDGETVLQEQAYARAGWQSKGQVATTLIENWQVTMYIGKSGEEARALCGDHTLLILAKADAPAGNCTVIDRKFLSERGALSISMTPKGPQITGSKDFARNRPWGY